MSDARLEAFCEALEIQNIPKLMTGGVGDFRRLGQVMAGRIKGLAAEIARLEAELQKCRDAHALRMKRKAIERNGTG